MQELIDQIKCLKTKRMDFSNWGSTTISKPCESGLKAKPRLMKVEQTSTIYKLNGNAQTSISSDEKIKC